MTSEGIGSIGKKGHPSGIVGRKIESAFRDELMLKHLSFILNGFVNFPYSKSEALDWFVKNARRSIGTYFEVDLAPQGGNYFFTLVVLAGEINGLFLERCLVSRNASETRVRHLFGDPQPLDI